MTTRARNHIFFATLMLLIVDMVLIGLFLLWAYASHYARADLWILGRNEFSMREGELTEKWGFLKLGVATWLLLAIAMKKRLLFLWGLAALMVVMTLSDSLQLHEQINAGLNQKLSGFLSRKHIDVATKLFLASAPLLAMVAGLYWGRPHNRKALMLLATPPMLLGFWSAVIDFAHSVIDEHFDGGRTIGSLIEEGGECLLITATLISVLHYYHITFATPLKLND
jgi:hypothetical protein